MSIFNILILSICTLLSSCSGTNTSQERRSEGEKVSRISQYTPPQVPAIFTTEREHREFLAKNYWGKFNFSQTATLDSRMVEDAYVRYLFVLSGVSIDVARQSMTNLINAAATDSLAFERFVSMSEAYLYDSNSMYRNEELYIPVLQYIISSPLVDELNRIRPQYQLDMALKNRVGEVATNFTITLNSGTQTQLSSIEAEHIILLFNNPDCGDCSRVKEFIVNNDTVFSRAKIVSIYVDSDLELWRAAKYPDAWLNGYDKGCVLTQKKLYDLKAIPTLYLLNREHQIVLKDAPVEIIAQYLMSSNSK